MLVCCIVKCGARKNENTPQLSLHRFPKNEGLKKKWLEAIGEENINPRHKEWYLCSLHFEESCFNRTLDVMRLHDNSVPTVFSTPDKKLHQVSSVLCETSNIKKSVVSCTSTVMSTLQSPYRIVETVHKEIVESEKVKALKEKCVKQQEKIKRLNEKIRKKNKKIANLKDIVEDLRRKNCISMEQAVVIEDLAGPKDFLKRQINKSKGLPTPNKHSEELRKFALTLHFLSPKAYNYIRPKWYQHVNCEPGFTKEAFETLKIKVQGSAHPVICSLVFDEMATRKSLTWEPRAQKYYGRVDHGHNLDNDSVEEASQALVVLLTAINGYQRLMENTYWLFFNNIPHRRAKKYHRGNGNIIYNITQENTCISVLNLTAQSITGKHHKQYALGN